MHKNKTLACLFAGLIIAGCQTAPDATVTPTTQISAGVPQTAQPLLDDPDQFHFVIVGDRTGRHRPGVFAQAMEQINLLRPEFVIGVGDSIEGYTEDPAGLDRQWQELDGLVNRLDMRFFYVAGNHDISNEFMLKDWQQRRGQDYYHFLYKNTLFIALNTEDPPTSHEKAARVAELGIDPAELEAVMRMIDSDPERVRSYLAERPHVATALQAIRDSDRVTISDAQVDYVRRALDENPDVLWTVVLMHKPAWIYDYEPFERIEAMLKGRRHTFVAGHLHSYSYLKEGGHEYIRMGTTGGLMNTDPEQGTAMDHVMWVTMTKDGPQIANLRLDGIHDRTGPRPPVQPSPAR